MKKRGILFLVILFSLLKISLSQIIIPVDISKPTPQFAENIQENYQLAFEHQGFDYQINVNKLTNDFIELSLLPSNIKFNLLQNDERELDINKDTIPDIKINLNSIQNNKASLIFSQVPIEKETPQQEQDLTPEEQQEISDSVQQFLQVAPHITSGLALASGQLTFFGLVKNYGFQYGFQALTKDNPEVGAAYSVFNALSQMKGAVTAPEKESQELTGSSIFNQNSYLIAASDGKDMYYDFGIRSDKTQDLSFLFEDAPVYTNNVDIHKEFNQDYLRFKFIGSNLEINGDLFINVKGYLDLSKYDAKILRANLISYLNNNDLKFSHINSIPFISTLSNSNDIAFDDVSNLIKTKKSKIELNENIISTNFDSQEIKSENSKVIAEIPTRSPVSFITTQDNNKVEAYFNIKSNQPIFSITKINPQNDWNIIFNTPSKILKLSPLSPIKLNFINGKITSAFLDNKNQEILFSSDQDIILKDNDNQIKILSKPSPAL